MPGSSFPHLSIYLSRYNLRKYLLGIISDRNLENPKKNIVFFKVFHGLLVLFKVFSRFFSGFSAFQGF